MQRAGVCPRTCCETLAVSNNQDVAKSSELPLVVGAASPEQSCASEQTDSKPVHGPANLYSEPQQDAARI